MTKDQLIRFKERIKPIFVFIILGFMYYAFIRVTDIKIPCPIKLIVGFDCPGCGATRMCLAILRFDFKEAFYYNKALFSLLPFLMFVLVFENYRYIKSGEERYTRISKVILVGSIITLLIFGVLRNI